MPKMTFRGVKIIDWKGCHSDTGQFVELNMSADFSDRVREAMGWDTSEELESLFPNLRESDAKAFDRATMLLPKGVKSVGLDGDVTVKSLELIPNGSELKKHQMDLDCSRISWFCLQRIKKPNGSFEWELRFTAIIGGTGAAKKIEGYIAGVGDNVAQMPVGYDKQEDLPLDEEEEDKQEALISKEQAEDTAAADEDMPRTSPPKSHQRAKQDAPGSRRQQMPDPA